MFLSNCLVEVDERYVFKKGSKKKRVDNMHMTPIKLRGQFQLLFNSFFVNRYTTPVIFIALSHAHFVLKVMSTYPIDQHQNAIPRAMPLQNLKKKKSTSSKSLFPPS